MTILNEYEEIMLKGIYKNNLLRQMYLDEEKINTDNLHINCKEFYDSIRVLEGRNQDEEIYVDGITYRQFEKDDAGFAEILKAPITEAGIRHVEMKYKIDNNLSLKSKFDLIMNCEG